MSLEHLCVPGVHENCQNREKLRGKGRPGVLWPALEKHAKPWRPIVLWLSAFLVASFLGVPCWALAEALPPEEILTSTTMMLLAFVVAIHLVLERLLETRSLRLPFLVPLACALAAAGFLVNAGYARLVVVPLAPPLLLVEAILFRRNVKTLASLGMLDQRTRRRWLRWSLLPNGLRPRSTVLAFCQALRDKATYAAETPRWIPGVWTPLCGVVLRSARSVVVIIWTGAAIAELSRPWTSLFYSESWHWAGAGAAMLLVFGLLPFLLWMAVQFLFSATILGKAYALREAQVSPNHFRRLLDRMLESKDKLERESLFLARTEDCGAPVLLHQSQQFQHTWVVGPSGSGKSAMLMMLIWQAIYRGMSVCVLDLKCQTYELLATMLDARKAACSRLGILLPEVKHVTLEQGHSSYLFNLFTQRWWPLLSLDQKVGVIMSGLSLLHSRAFGESYYTDQSYKLLSHCLARWPSIQSWTDLERACHDASRYARPWELSQNTKRDGEHITLVIGRLATISPFNPHPGLRPEVEANAVDFTDGFSSLPHYYFFGLNANKNRLMAGEAARLAAAGLLNAACALQSRPTGVLLVIDELQEAVKGTDALETLFAQARALGIAVIAANQTTSQLVDKHYDMRSTVEATATQVWCGSDDDMGREQIRKLAGQHLDVLVSRRVDHEGNVSRTYTPQIVDRVPGTLASEVSSDPKRVFLRLCNNQGYAAYDGLVIAAQQMFHWSEKQYKSAVAMPWPAPTAHTLVNGALPPVPQTPPPAPASSRTTRARWTRQHSRSGNGLTTP